MAPQIIMIILWFLNMMLTSYLHGQPKKDKHNVFTTMVATLIQFLLLWWGGFFSVWF